jgi:hypothetical protein
MAIWRRKITVNDDHVTSAVHLTLAQSLIPNFLGTDSYAYLSFRILTA